MRIKMTYFLAIICAMFLYACNNHDPKGGMSSEDSAKIAMWDTIFGKTTPKEILDKDMIIHDTLWVRRAINRYQKFYKDSTKDHGHKAYTEAVLYDLVALRDWLIKVKNNTTADTIAVLFGKYPNQMTNLSTEPCTAPDCDMPHSTPGYFKRNPKRITAIFWPYKGKVPARPHTGKADGDADPYNLGEIHP